ncbi:hypothetical protein DFQ27_003851 [Actinomortierella ambigua]|uniref:Zn(2)-C6 fungal-type domain-containing protein n=1 Tax=Actinomortierella ambigua TaxID=1343610 RepID=A0A9P6QHY8_9FUNG|nr:hypothetical protein DFQ27_003851 [Actinomortierella ambigua]
MRPDSQASTPSASAASSPSPSPSPAPQSASRSASVSSSQAQQANPNVVLKIRDACIPCRKQRSKCDGQPLCSRCTRLGLDCTYVELVHTPAPVPAEPWQEFLTTTGAKMDALSKPPEELLKENTMEHATIDTELFPWQQSKTARRRKQQRCTCGHTPAGQESSSPLAMDHSSQSASFTAFTPDAQSASETGSSSSTATPRARKGRTASSTCPVHSPSALSRSNSFVSSSGSLGLSVGSASAHSHHPHRRPETSARQLPSSVIETSEKINSLSAKLSRLFVFPTEDRPAQPVPQLEILQSRSLSPLLQSHLLQLYMSQCFPVQPIIDPPTFMAQLAAQNFCQPPHPLLVAAMCACATRCMEEADVERLWASQDPPLPDPGFATFANKDPHVRSMRDRIWSIGEHFASLAKAYLRAELPLVQSPDRSGGLGDPLTVVQGLIMIATWDGATGRQRECQACAGLALRIMIAGGWHLMDDPNGDGCTDSKIKGWGTLERELARRCWWCVWIAEKWTAAILTQYVTLSLPREFRQGDPADRKIVSFFHQMIQMAYLCGAVIQLHYHPYESEDGTEHKPEADMQGFERLQARQNEIDERLDTWHKSTPQDFVPDWDQTPGGVDATEEGFEPKGDPQIFAPGGDWWWRHGPGSLREVYYLALKLLLHRPQHVVSKIPSSLTDLQLAQLANKITLTCEQLWHHESTRGIFYHMAGLGLWFAMVYQQDNTLSENPRIRTPAGLNMQKSYFLLKKAGRLVHTTEDEKLTELESMPPNGAEPATIPWARSQQEQAMVKPMLRMFREIFPIVRQELRDKGFGLRTRPSTAISSSGIQPLPASSTEGHPALDRAIALTDSPVAITSIDAGATNVIQQQQQQGSNPALFQMASNSYIMAPLTPPGANTSPSSPMLDQLSAQTTPSPTPHNVTLSNVHNASIFQGIVQAADEMHQTHQLGQGPPSAHLEQHQQLMQQIHRQLQQFHQQHHCHQQPPPMQQHQPPPPQQQPQPSAGHHHPCALPGQPHQQFQQHQPFAQPPQPPQRQYHHQQPQVTPSSQQPLPLSQLPPQQPQPQHHQLQPQQQQQQHQASPIVIPLLGVSQPTVASSLGLGAPTTSTGPPGVGPSTSSQLYIDPMASYMINTDPFSSIIQNENPNVLSSLIDYSEWINHSLE